MACRSRASWLRPPCAAHPSELALPLALPLAVIIVLLQVINVGIITALFAILGVSAIALYISCILPMVFFTMAKLFVPIWLPFPPYMPVNGTAMNYAGPIMGAVLLFALADCCVSG